MVTVIPSGWIFLQGFGIRQMTAGPDIVVASVGLGEDSLTEEDALSEYIEKQKKLIEHTLKNATFAGPQPLTFPGADQALLFMVRHEMEGAGNMTHVQTYVRCGLWVGIITFTALHVQVPAARPDYDAFVKGLRIVPQKGSEEAVNSQQARPSMERA
jgi:hypothetical protein